MKVTRGTGLANLLIAMSQQADADNPSAADLTPPSDFLRAIYGL
jgi:hypothetical protein